MSIPRILREEIFTMGGGGYDEAAERYLRRLRGVSALIVGHSHLPRYRVLPSQQLVLNTGTWIKMIHLDLHYLGQDSGLTYALIEHTEDGAPDPKLMRWHGSKGACEAIPYDN
jgi:predicted phosphodiesterase